MRDTPLRRHHRLRAIAKATKAYPTHGAGAVKKLAGNRKSCSCAMCGNPRRFAKGNARLTIQELRADGNDAPEIS